MVKLETVEDFDKVKKALDDPRSKFHRYCIKGFGYCTACKTLTEHEKGTYNIENTSEVCLRCKRIFDITRYSLNPGNAIYHRCQSDGHAYLTYSAKLDIPEEFREELERLNSREFQNKVFRAELDKFIKKEKAKARQHDKNVRRVAKLRF